MYSCMNSPDDFYEVYAPQSGGSAVAYKASYHRQKGYGIGGIFGAISRRLIPFFQNHILPHVLPAAKSAVRNITLDVIDNPDSFKQSLRSNASQAIKEMGRSAVSQLGSGKRRKRRRVIRKTAAKKRKVTTRRKVQKKTSRRRRLFFKKSLFD